MAKVDVYILAEEGCTRNIDRLKELFLSDIFDVNIVVPDESNDLFPWCLAETSICHPDREVIYINGRSVSNVSKQKLEDLVIFMNKKSDNFDLFYMCRWNDDCQKMIDIKYYPFLDVNIGRTYSPQGLQAVYISTKGRDTILGKVNMRNGKKLILDRKIHEDKILVDHIKRGDIVAHCTVNNIFNYDISVATKNSDFNKLSLCKNMDNPESDKEPQTNNLNYLWFILVVIIAVMFTFAIIRIGR